MATERDRKHLLIVKPPREESYTPHSGGNTKHAPEPVGGRPAHGTALKTALEAVVVDAASRTEKAEVQVQTAAPGIYVQFESFPGVPLAIQSLEDRSKGIEVTAVSESSPTPGQESDGKVIQKATVWIPDGQIAHFINRFEKYALTIPKAKKTEHRYEDMVDRIANLRLATLRALWTDDDAAYPQEDSTCWLEVWLRKTDGHELTRLLDFASQVGMTLGERRLEFDDRIVVLALTSAKRLSSSLYVLNDLAEVRRAKDLATFFVNQPPIDQAAWSADLAARLTPPANNAPAVCVLDTGVSRGHPLLSPALAEEDVHAANPAWGGADDGGGKEMMGHGTEMAGLALYGDLTPILSSSGPLSLQHRLETVKLLPPARAGVTPPDLYGAITAMAVSYPEIQAPDRRRVFSMAVTASDYRDRGKPTSWSAAVDALAAGRAFDPSTQGLIYIEAGSPKSKRLFVISAGNVSQHVQNYLDRSDLEPVQDPAQAWNALTVGAYTDRAVLTDPEFRDKKPLAKAGDLSPFSTTSVTFEKTWPNKPDVVAEGGNVVVSGKGACEFPIGDLSLLTTHFKPSDKLFVLSWATSAACAQVARICGLIAAEYQTLWPETIRALVVQSAEWTPAMRSHLAGAGDSKRAKSNLVRRYGFGVPNIKRALRSAKDALTLLVQGVIHPFRDGRMREMHLYELPWPKAVLESLGETPVQLRVTLSYFVEPNPSRRGWQKRHRYQSHGLRFEMKGALESVDEFRKRLNEQALEAEEDRPKAATDDGWYLGYQTRNRGSLHSDIWTGTAADLADRGVVAVFPVSGWWKEQKAGDRSVDGARYALVVSIETPGVEADIWTPVAAQVAVPIEIAVET
jgi:hypothetical protein